jgi:hypothetical protein
MKGVAIGLGKVMIPRLDQISFGEGTVRKSRKGFYGNFLDSATEST